MINRTALLSLKKLLARTVAVVAFTGPLVVSIADTEAIRAQQAASSKFEVTSVKPNKSGVRRYDINPKGNRFVATNVSLWVLVEWAYQMEEFRISGGPAWLKSDRFDIEANAEKNVSMEQFRVLLQPLLADRFHVQLHRETKEFPIYNLAVAKGGPKLKAAQCVGTPSPANPCGGFSGTSRGTLVGRAASIAAFATTLSGILGRSVRDNTALKGMYDFDLSWTPDETARQGTGDPDAPPADINGPSFFTAVQEQLGLKLESAKGPVEVLMIDHAEQPAEN
ncbi:MAG: TIGR03435 family protein [Acidobacteriota bacterium]